MSFSGKYIAEIIIKTAVTQTCLPSAVRQIIDGGKGAQLSACTLCIVP